VLLLIIAVWLGGMFNIHSTNKQNAKDKQALNDKIDVLNQQGVQLHTQLDSATGTLAHINDCFEVIVDPA